jgi:hypothetical protein
MNKLIKRRWPQSQSTAGFKQSRASETQEPKLCAGIERKVSRASLLFALHRHSGGNLRDLLVADLCFVIFTEATRIVKQISLHVCEQASKHRHTD